MTPLRAAALARRFRVKARTAFTAGQYDRAAVLFRMAATTQERGVLPW